MIANRRSFLQTMGASAVGLGVAAALPQSAAQAQEEAGRGGSHMKMIIRIDDVGYSNVCNIGAFETIERGVATSADTMMDTPGTVDALERLKNFPWISVGWHAHFWGSPVLDPKEIPSMIIKEGDRIRFRKDLRKANDVVYEEALKECRAQIERCCKILGRAPDTGSGTGDTPLGKAMAKVCDEFGVLGGFEYQQTVTDTGVKLTPPANEKWASRNLYKLDPKPAYKELYTDSVTELEKYDPVKYYTEDRAHLKEIPAGATVEQSWHPGYVDYYVYRLGDYGPYARNFIPSRTVDVEALCSEKLKNWIKENHIELVNYRDALFGTREYQNHLRLTDSDLYMA
jgi:predicted glycoside hydrolase/deacetylase ChbG (UPF0249 family)